MLVDLDIYVEHANLSEELRELFLGCHVVLVDQVFLNLLFNLFLSLSVVGVCVHESCHSLLFFSSCFELFLQTGTYHLFNFVLVARLKSCCQFLILGFELSSEVRIFGPTFLEIFYLSFNLLILLIVINLVKHLIERHLWLPSYVLLQASKKVVEQVFIALL